MSTFFTLIIAAYCFVVQFGSLFRYGPNEIAFGASTALAVFLILATAIRIPGQLRSVPVLWGFTLLFLWFLLSSMLSLTGIMGAYLRIATLILYLCLAASVSSAPFSEKQLRIVAYAITIGLLLSSGLTVIDYKGIVNVPHCNEVVASTRVQKGDYRVVMQAGGFFPRRSAMAAVFSLSITMSAILALSARGWISKLLYGCSALSGCLAILLSHNRSGIIAVAVSLLCYLLFSNLISFGTRVKVAIVGGTIAAVLIFLASVYYPGHVEVYKRKMPLLFPNSSIGYSEGQSASDAIRIDNFKTAIYEIGKNPFGHGLGNMPHEKYGLINSHNLFTSLLWAGGIVTLVWVLPFSFCFTKTLFSKTLLAPDAIPYFDALRFSIIGFLFHNMAHDSIGTGLFWIFLATIISIKYIGITGASPLQNFGFYSASSTPYRGSY